MNKPFDPGKPCRTRDGRKVRILATDCEGPRKIAALVDFPPSGPGVFLHYLDGKYCLLVEDNLDLVNIPEKCEAWIAIGKASTVLQGQVEHLCFARRYYDELVAAYPKTNGWHHVHIEWEE